MSDYNSRGIQGGNLANLSAGLKAEKPYLDPANLQAVATPVKSVKEVSLQAAPDKEVKSKSAEATPENKHNFSSLKEAAKIHHVGEYTNSDYGINIKNLRKMEKAEISYELKGKESPFGYNPNLKIKDGVGSITLDYLNKQGVFFKKDIVIPSCWRDVIEEYMDESLYSKVYLYCHTYFEKYNGSYWDMEKIIHQVINLIQKNLDFTILLDNDWDKQFKDIIYECIIHGYKYDKYIKYYDILTNDSNKHWDAFMISNLQAIYYGVKLGIDLFPYIFTSRRKYDSEYVYEYNGYVTSNRLTGILYAYCNNKDISMITEFTDGYDYSLQCITIDNKDEVLSNNGYSYKNKFDSFMKSILEDYGDLDNHVNSYQGFKQSVAASLRCYDSIVSVITKFWLLGIDVSNINTKIDDEVVAEVINAHLSGYDCTDVLVNYRGVAKSLFLIQARIKGLDGNEMVDFVDETSYRYINLMKYVNIPITKALLTNNSDFLSYFGAHFDEIKFLYSHGINSISYYENGKELWFLHAVAEYFGCDLSRLITEDTDYVDACIALYQSLGYDITEIKRSNYMVDSKMLSLISLTLYGLPVNIALEYSYSSSLLAYMVPLVRNNISYIWVTENYHNTKGSTCDEIISELMNKGYSIPSYLDIRFDDNQLEVLDSLVESGIDIIPLLNKYFTKGYFNAVADFVRNGGDINSIDNISKISENAFEFIIKNGINFDYSKYPITVSRLEEYSTLGIDITSLIEYGFDDYQITQIVSGIISKIDINPYYSLSFDGYQMNEIKLGIIKGLPITIYASSKYNWEQMREIRLGLLSKINVIRYANSVYSATKMRVLRKCMEYKISIMPILGLDLSETMLLEADSYLDAFQKLPVFNSYKLDKSAIDKAHYAYHNVNCTDMEYYTYLGFSKEQLFYINSSIEIGLATGWVCNRNYDAGMIFNISQSANFCVGVNVSNISQINLDVKNVLSFAGYNISEDVIYSD